MGVRPENGGTGQEAGARAVLRVLGVLTELALRPAGMTLTELSARLGVPKASLHRMLKTLRNAGYLLADGNRFRLGPATAALARMVGDAAAPPPFPACLQPVLDWLAGETRETVMLGVPDEAGDDVVYVAVVESSQPIRFGVAVGERRPIYCAASGQAILAFQPQDHQRDYLMRTRFVAFTPLTCDRARLSQRLVDVRASGIAIDRGGRVEAASGIASPVFDADGNVRAALSVAGPAERIAENVALLGDRCHRAGERASRILGYRGDYPC